jgi:DNA-binding transcriptional regulator YbjK
MQVHAHVYARACAWKSLMCMRSVRPCTIAGTLVEQYFAGVTSLHVTHTHTHIHTHTHTHIHTHIHTNTHTNTHTHTHTHYRLSKHREKLASLMKEWGFKDEATAEAFLRRQQRVTQARDVNE